MFFKCFTVAVERGDPSKGPSVILPSLLRDVSLRSTGILRAKPRWSLAGRLRRK